MRLRVVGGPCARGAVVEGPLLPVAPWRRPGSQAVAKRASRIPASAQLSEALHTHCMRGHLTQGGSSAHTAPIQAAGCRPVPVAACTHAAASRRSTPMWMVIGSTGLQATRRYLTCTEPRSVGASISKPKTCRFTCKQGFAVAGAREEVQGEVPEDRKPWRRSALHGRSMRPHAAHDCACRRGQAGGPRPTAPSPLHAHNAHLAAVAAVCALVRDERLQRPNAAVAAAAGALNLQARAARVLAQARNQRVGGRQACDEVEGPGGQQGTGASSLSS